MEDLAVGGSAIPQSISKKKRRLSMCSRFVKFRIDTTCWLCEYGN
jgi:hypothetical protein